ncbi:hypothetical protein RB595_006434 [Gaeumannomyces hyphopodioides]
MQAAATMDITGFVVSSREKAMLYGDYATYRTQLATKLLNCRKKLSIAAKSRSKFQSRPLPAPELLSQNREYLVLYLLTAERAWAHAMSMKAAHAADNKGITGSTRSHTVSRLHKAARTAEQLAAALSDPSSGAGQVDILEATAYAALLRGAEQLEKQSWEPCLRSYATARVVYSVLSASTQKETFKDLLSETIDPSIRYAAYQLKTPRSLPIPTIARKAFPHDDETLVASIKSLDPKALSEEDGGDSKGDTPPTTITFRSREVRIEDAAIATAWLALQAAKSTLAEKLAAGNLSPRDMAAAYDDVLTASQDSVDATKQAIDELKAEGVPQGDPRMQSLAITRTAVSYEMISWRIGRNRVLTGSRDGSVIESAPQANKRRKTAPADDTAPAKPEPTGRQLAKLKEKAVLYDGTIQSLESIKELPGVAADGELAARLNATSQYFTALKCLAIGRSHIIVGNLVNALALIKHGSDQCQQAAPVLTETPASQTHSSLRSVDVLPEDAKFVAELLAGEVQRYRALVEIDSLRKQGKAGGSRGDPSLPLAERLALYPSDGVDLRNIVAYPPKLDPVPVKPVFMDIAYNYIDYSHQGKSEAGAAEKTADKGAVSEQKKKGWFGFGR